MAKTDLTAQRLREILHYDPLTGVFTWLIDVGPMKSIRAGTVAGSPTGKSGRTWIGTGRKVYYASRLAFLYMTGKWPQGDAEHRDGDPTNDRWENLRDTTHKVNTQNRRSPTRTKKSGLPLGVSIRKRDGAIIANICIDGKQVYLGQFADAEQAHQAYLDTKRKKHEGCTI